MCNRPKPEWLNCLRYTAGHFFVSVDSPCSRPKPFDALSDQARACSAAIPPSSRRTGKPFKVLMQGAFSKLDLVSRDEFDSQMVVLGTHRARLEALEQQVAELKLDRTRPRRTRSGLARGI